jgi:hypothetical protein
MAYIGRQLVRGQNRVLDDISGSFNGSTTAFNLTVSSSSSPPASVNQLWIILGGVLQKPGTDFTVADAVITFTTAPASTLSFWGMIQGDTSDINSPADASVTPSKIANSGDFAFPADVRFNDADGSHYVGLQAPSTVSSNLVWTLPAADGSANQVLKTDGSGALGWASDANAPEGTAVLSTGETGTTKYLRVDGDNTCSWQLAVDATKTTLTGSTNNTIPTVTGANAIQGESNLTYDGDILSVGTGSGGAIVKVVGAEGGNAELWLQADEGDNDADNWLLYSNASNNKLKIATKATGSYVDIVNFTTAGNIEIEGNIVPANGKGIDFSATSGTGTSELFDDYEEGTWTPTFVTNGASSTFPTQTYADQGGFYTKVGDLVFLTFNCKLADSGITGGTNYAALGGFPFPIYNSTSARGLNFSISFWEAWDGGSQSNNTPMGAMGVNNASWAYLMGSDNSRNNYHYIAAQGYTNGTRLMAAITYKTN